MATLPLLPDAPRYDCRLAPRMKVEDNVSPKSVITDIRFISPASSSSSSMDHRPLSDATHVKLQQPRHDRGYSISDGDSSDQELSKTCALESLPETHSLALKATRINIPRGESRSYQSAAMLPTIEDKHQIDEQTNSSTVRNPVDLPGTPIRLFPGWQAQLRSPGGSSIPFGSPGFEKGSYSPATRYFSGPLQSPRPPPSKWDDAEKWIVSPGHHESSPQPQLHRPTAQALLSSGRRHSISGNCHRPNFGLGSPEFSAPTAEETPRSESLSRSGSQKKRSKTLSFGDLSKRVFDVSCSNTCQTTTPDGPVPEVEESPETPCNDVKELNEVPSNVLPSTLEDEPRGASRRDENSTDVEILKHALTGSDLQQEQATHAAAGPPPPSEHSWKFGIRTAASTENSRPGTPVLTASPTRHNTPTRSLSTGQSLTAAGEPELQTCQFAKFELSNLGDDARNIAWITREEEDMECSASLRDNDSGVLDRAVYDEKIAAHWEEAEQTEDKKRCDKEDARIKAWEELQTSKAEAEMQKLEMKIEKMRLRALEKMTNRIALARKKAKEMRASAEALARADQRQLVKQTHVPVLGHVSTIPKFKCCFKP